MDTSFLKVKRGDNILSAWKKLLAWVETTRVIAGPGQRIHVTPAGTRVYVDDPSRQWAHPWRVHLSGGEASIEAGNVNGEPAMLNGLTLDGFNKDEVQVTPPRLKVKGVKAGKTWICLKVTTREGVIVADDLNALTVVEVSSLDPRLIEGGSPDKDGVGLHVLAFIRWRDSKPLKVVQNTHFDLQHRFIPANDGRPARHVFWGM
ncbi:hypothetical protein [Verrucomicrobium sp. BvORR106]|uniref:hypothetical protein n=1 Tax=Verrucomicrobium sp. BvORR106 TaxID=1403819 RepID=UPI0005717232|nr:hypothetical protein [Verrucomicrobium sp. BvORR106]